jgi:hypothetical protein
LRTLAEIIEIIKTIIKVANDADVAMMLNIKPKTLATAKLRNSIPFEELTTFCNANDISLNWLLTDEGPMMRKYSLYSPECVVDIAEIPKENIKEWIDDFWEKANDNQRGWLITQFDLYFPQYREWLIKKEADEKNKKSIGRLAEPQASYTVSKK